MIDATIVDTSPEITAQAITTGKVKSGILWITGITAFRDGLQFLMTVVLVRILSPKAYGEFSLVTAFVGFFSILSFRSCLEYTLQMRPGERVDYDMHFTIGALFQALALVTMNLTALVLRRLPDYAAVAPLLHVMSVYFLLDWVGELRVKMLERSLDWRRLRLLEGVGAVLNAVAAIGMALGGAGVYALLLPGLFVTVPFIVDLLLVERWRPKAHWNFPEFRPAWRYGLARMGSALVIRGQQVLEGTCLVAAIGYASFGIYGRAVGLAAICCLKLPSLAAITLFPMLTRLQPGSPEMRRASALILRCVVWSSFPMAMFVALLGVPIIRALYGAKWLSAAPLLPWALTAAAITSLADTSNFLLLAGLRTRQALVIDLLRLTGVGLSLLFLLSRGLVVYLGGLAGVQLVLCVFAISWLWSSRSIAWSGIRSAFAYPLLAIPCIAIIGRFALPFFSQAHNPYLFLPIAGILLALLYFLPLRWVAAEELTELVNYLPGSIGIKALLRLEPA